MHRTIIIMIAKRIRTRMIRISKTAHSTAGRVWPGGRRRGARHRAPIIIIIIIPIIMIMIIPIIITIHYHPLA